MICPSKEINEKREIKNDETGKRGKSMTISKSTKRMRITSESWLQKIRDGGGLFHIRMAVNLVG